MFNSLGDIRLICPVAGVFRLVIRAIRFLAKLVFGPHPLPGLGFLVCPAFAQQGRAGNGISRFFRHDPDRGLLAVWRSPSCTRAFQSTWPAGWAPPLRYNRVFDRVRGQRGEVSPGWFLVEVESEIPRYRHQVIENVCLDVFIGDPLGHVCERIDFQRESRRPRLQLAYDQRHTLVDPGMMFQVVEYIGAECADIG